MKVTVNKCGGSPTGSGSGGDGNVAKQGLGISEASLSKVLDTSMDLAKKELGLLRGTTPK